MINRKYDILNKAFSLAEVLVTIGIIGVVAALTIPVLMSQIQDRQLKAAAKAAYSKMAVAVNLMKNDSNNLSAYYTSNDNSFKNDIEGYLKVAQDTNNDGIIPAVTNSNIYFSLSGAHADTSYFKNGQFTTVDGMLWLISTNHANYVLIGVDVNGVGKPPNTYGRDFFFFEIRNDMLLPEGANNTNWYSTVDWFCNKTRSDTIQGIACMCNVISGTDYAY